MPSLVDRLKAAEATLVCARKIIGNTPARRRPLALIATIQEAERILQEARDAFG